MNWLTRYFNCPWCHYPIPDCICAVSKARLKVQGAMPRPANDNKPSIKQRLRLAGALGLLVLAGCDRHDLTNDQIITETKKCHNAGMRANLETLRYTGVDVAVKVLCEPKD